MEGLATGVTTHLFPANIHILFKAMPVQMKDFECDGSTWQGTASRQADDTVSWESSRLTCPTSWVVFPAPIKPDVVVHSCDSSTCKEQGFKVNLRFTRSLNSILAKLGSVLTKCEQENGHSLRMYVHE